MWWIQRMQKCCDFQICQQNLLPPKPPNELLESSIQKVPSRLYLQTACIWIVCVLNGFTLLRDRCRFAYTKHRRSTLSAPATSGISGYDFDRESSSVIASNRTRCRLNRQPRAGRMWRTRLSALHSPDMIEYDAQIMSIIIFSSLEGKSCMSFVGRRDT